MPAVCEDAGRRRGVASTPVSQGQSARIRGCDCRMLQNGKLNALTRNTAIWARVTGLVGQ